MTPDPILDIAIDADDLADRVAIWLGIRIAMGDAPFKICLAGGSTPKKLYSLLATEAFTSHIDWTKIELFFGDERFVPFDSPDSNFRMVNEAWFAHVPLEPGQIHKIPVDAATPEAAATAYQETLQKSYGAEKLDPAKPLFDVVLLGLGTDGHTASLFPGTKAIEERTAWATSVIGAKPEPRISLTYPVLESTASIVFLVSGADKQSILKQLIEGDQSLPAARLQTSGKILIYTDRAATGLD